MMSNFILVFSIFLLTLQTLNGYEDLRLHIVDVTKGRKEIFIGTVKNGSTYNVRVVEGNAPKSFVSSAIFIEQINSTGWGFLSVQSHQEYSDEHQAYYAGVAEGIITRPILQAHLANTYAGYCSKLTPFCLKLKQYLSTNIESMIVRSRHQGGYFKMLRLMLWQIKGIQDGYDNKYINNSNNINENYLMQLKNQVFGIFIMNADGDLSALAEILNGSEYHKTFPGHKIIGDGSCSAFIKYVKGDIYASHVTWNSFNSMLRLTKSYNFPYRLDYIENSSSIIPGQHLSFSSYPGQISSIDDFYITSGGLITIETTIGNYNASLWIPLKHMAPHIVLEYFRVQIANRLSKSGEEWVSYFSQHNSGTYNNQWMIVNTNLMKGHKYGMAIPDKVLYVAEQIPGLVKYRDVTDYLRTSYWASYNIPFYKEVYDMSGYGEMAKKYGDFFTIDKGPRALIFKRDAHKVTDLFSLMRLMRYNDYKHDDLSRCNCTPPYSAENGISARSDLNPINGTYPFGALGYRLHGGTDLKMTNLMLASQLLFIGISSPTYDQQPMFDWRKVPGKSVSHKLQPTVFNFKPVLVPFP